MIMQQGERPLLCCSVSSVLTCMVRPNMALLGGGVLVWNWSNFHNRYSITHLQFEISKQQPTASTGV